MLLARLMSCKTGEFGEVSGHQLASSRLQPLARPRLSTYLNIHGPQLNITANIVRLRGSLSGKLLVVIVSGDDPYKVQWGLRLALNAYRHPYGEKLVDDVKVLLFGLGCSIVNPKMPYYDAFKERLDALTNAGVDVATCVTIVNQLNLEEESKALGIELVHASVYTSQCVRNGYTVMTF